MKMIYYVSVNGNDKADGSQGAPFRTISHAAQIACPGDTVRVYGGTYREWVDPLNSGKSNSCRITYEAVQGEHPIIKGSEVVTDWEHVEGKVWKKVLPNSFFGDFNPFATVLSGDWLVKPDDRHVHLGDVYLNGVSMYEAADMDALRVAERRERGEHNEKIRYPEQTVYQWYAQVDDISTVIWCNFGEYDPNNETVEISVRGSCFFPRRTGVNYITVRGFEMAHAATQFAPPTAEQEGLIGPNWSCGWIIENNCLHDSKCCVVSLGKERSTGNNDHAKFMRKSGYQYYIESIFLAQKLGWSKERIGSHIVRNNEIYNCGQAGIVGHLGSIFSRIEHNLIYNVNTKQEFWGHELAGIKFHAAIDTVIENNNINNCNLGLWLDWQAQGTRVTKNLFFENSCDFFLEVSHGPCLVDHNLFLSPRSFQNASQGTAYVHNLICGSVVAYSVLDRATPYHYPHSTDMAGYAFVYGGDERVINNIIIGTVNPQTESVKYLGAIYDKYNVPEEYMPAIREIGPLHEDKYFKVPQPVWMEQNAYSGYAKPFRAEVEPISADGMSASVAEENGEWVLTLDVPSAVVNVSCRSVTTERLGSPRITEGAYENADGTPLDLSCDMLGARRSERIIPGAIAELREGLNRITVWKR